MYFTREPQLETVITAREGHQLVLQCQVGEEVTEYRLGAVEVVTFGRAQCFRSCEEDVPFLLPVEQCSLFEVVHIRLTKKALLLPERRKNEGDSRRLTYEGRGKSHRRRSAQGRSAPVESSSEGKEEEPQKGEGESKASDFVEEDGGAPKKRRRRTQSPKKDVEKAEERGTETVPSQREKEASLAQVIEKEGEQETPSKADSATSAPSKRGTKGRRSPKQSSAEDTGKKTGTTKSVEASTEQDESEAQKGEETATREVKTPSKRTGRSRRRPKAASKPEAQMAISSPQGEG